MNGNKSRDLVLVRIGPRTRHQSFAPVEQKSNRPWDLALSIYENVDPKLLAGADYSHYKVGGKWNGIFDFFRLHPELLDRYEYFWIPDDDITTSTASVSRLFTKIREHGLELAQPSLSLQSNYYHYVTLHNDAFSLRRTNFVELMVPVFHRDLLKKLLHMFEGNWAGMGLDMVWPNYTSDRKSCIGILDDVVVRHHGELGTFLYSRMRSFGIIPMIEYRQNAKRYNIWPRIPRAQSGILKDGTVVDDRLTLYRHLVMARRRNKSRIAHNPVTLHNIYRLLFAYFESYKISHMTYLKQVGRRLRELL